MAWLFSMIIQHFGNNVVKGGMRNLPLALARFLEAHNGEIRTNAQVTKIIVENGKALGVRLLDGEEIEIGKLITSNAHPRHLVLDLLEEDQVGKTLANKMRQYELGEPVLVVYLALDGLPTYKAGPQAGKSIYVHPSPGCKEWDLCAPCALLEAAGGQMSDCWGNELYFNRPDVRAHNGVVASNGIIHDRIIDTVARICEEFGYNEEDGFW